MNIFAIHEDPRVAARMLCDSHIVKMPIEAVQMLSMAMEHYGCWQEGMAKISKPHFNHPCSKWARESWANFVWLTAHAQEGFKEYTRRYKRKHECELRLDLILLIVQRKSRAGDIKLTHWAHHTPFVQAMDDEFKHADGVQAYRNLYILKKSRFAKWAHSPRPSWMDEAPVLQEAKVNSADDAQRDRAPHPSDVRLPGEGRRRRRGSTEEQRGRAGSGNEPGPTEAAGGTGEGKPRRAVGRAKRAVRGEGPNP